MELTGKQKRHLRGLGHHLDPVFISGKNGLDEPQYEAIKQALLDHELIKVKRGKQTEMDKGEFVVQIEKHTPAVCVQKIGRMVLLFAPHPEKPVIKLPK